MMKAIFHGLRKLLRDDEGSVMTEYIVTLCVLLVAFIWLNKTMDTVLFGESPYRRTGRPMAVEAIPSSRRAGGQAYQSMGESFGFDAEMVKILRGIGGDQPSANAKNPDRAYLPQLYISLSRP